MIGRAFITAARWAISAAIGWIIGCAIVAAAIAVGLL